MHTGRHESSRTNRRDGTRARRMQRLVGRRGLRRCLFAGAAGGAAADPDGRCVALPRPVVLDRADRSSCRRLRGDPRRARNRAADGNRQSLRRQGCVASGLPRLWRGSHQGHQRSPAAMADARLAVPKLAAARLEGYFNIRLKVTSSSGYSGDLPKSAGWHFRPKCRHGACDVIWSDNASHTGHAHGRRGMAPAMSSPTAATTSSPATARTRHRCCTSHSASPRPAFTTASGSPVALGDDNAERGGAVGVRSLPDDREAAGACDHNLSHRLGPPLASEVV